MVKVKGKGNTGAFTKFIKSFGIFMIGTMLSKIIMFFMLPVYTSKIPTNDMGYYDVSLTYITVLISTIFCNVWVTILRFMYDEKKLKNKVKVFYTGGAIFLISTILYSLLGLSFWYFTEIKYISLIFLYGMFTNLGSLFSFLARGLEKNLDFAISGIINTIVTVVVNLVLILGFSTDFSALYIAPIVGYCFQIIYLITKLNIFKIFKECKVEKKLIQDMVKYTLPLGINSISYWLLTSVNKIVINYIYGDSTNGIYAIGNKFGAIVALVTNCFTYAWQDISFSHDNNSSDKGKFYSTACQMYIKFLFAGVAVALPALSIIFPILINKAYYESKNTIPLFLIVAVVSAISIFVENIFYAIKETKTIFYSMVVSSVFNLLICYYLIYSFKIDGSNISVLLSFILNILIRAYMLNKKMKFELKFRNCIVLITWVIVTTIIYKYCNALVNFVTFIVNGVITVFLFKEYIVNILKRKIFRGKFSLH